LTLKYNPYKYRFAHAPELNDVLHLTGRGITELKCLEPFVNLLSIHLTSNAITTLHGLRPLRKLRSLHVAFNSISTLDGVENLTELRFIDVSNNNKLHCLSAIAYHDSIEVILCTNNKSIKSIEALSTLPSLTTLDVSNCAITGGTWGGEEEDSDDDSRTNNEKSLAQICKTKRLASLNLNGNPILTKISQPFRAFCIAIAPELQNLNEIPIFTKERRISEAYILRGGRQAVKAEKQAIEEEEANEREEQWDWFNNLVQMEKQKCT